MLSNSEIHRLYSIFAHNICNPSQQRMDIPTPPPLRLVSSDKRDGTEVDPTPARGSLRLVQE